MIDLISDLEKSLKNFIALESFELRVQKKKRTQVEEVEPVDVKDLLYIKRGALELMLSHQLGHVSIGERLSQISFFI